MWRCSSHAAKAACLAVAFLLISTNVRGDDSPPRIDGDGAAIPHPGHSEAWDETPGSRSLPVLEHRSILLDLARVSAPDFTEAAFLSEVAPEAAAPGSTIHAYKGLHAIAVRRLFGYYRKLFGNSLHDRWLGTSDTIFDLDRRIRREMEDEQDLQTGGRWWDRTWRQSLVPWRGGAPATPRLVTTGSELELFRLGEIVLTNEGRVRLGRLALYLDDDRIYERLEQRTKDALLSSSSKTAPRNPPANPNPTDKIDKPAKTVVAGENKLDVSVALVEEDAVLDLERVLAGTARSRSRRQLSPFATPRGNLLSGEGWNVSGRPNLQLRLPDMGESGTLASAISSASFQLDLNLYPGEARQLFAIVSLSLRALPGDRELTATVELEVVRW